MAGVGVFSISILHHVFLLFFQCCLFNGTPSKPIPKLQIFNFRIIFKKTKQQKKQLSKNTSSGVKQRQLHNFFPLPTPPPSPPVQKRLRERQNRSVQSFAKCCPIYSDSERSCKVPQWGGCFDDQPGKTPDTTVTRLDLQYSLGFMSVYICIYIWYTCLFKTGLKDVQNMLQIMLNMYTRIFYCSLNGEYIFESEPRDVWYCSIAPPYGV